MTDYKKFYQLHQRTQPFILPNIWNVKSAQLVEMNGFDAVATSSGAISNSLGYEDGEKIPFANLLYIIHRIKSSINIPLSIDLEKGYTDNLNELTENVQRLIDIGIAGINLEDSKGEDIYLKKLSAIRNYLDKSGQQLFINARTDGFLLKIDKPLETTIKRAKLYQEAGADGLFVTAVGDPAIIKEIASSITLPLNVVGSRTVPSIQALSDCGVRRISMAVLLYNASYNHLGRLLKNVKDGQSLDPLF